jgi:N-terminal acetyltransferase B complex non-catalytic subunit
LTIFFARDRNWLEFLSILDSTLPSITAPHGEVVPDLNEADAKECIEQIAKNRTFFLQLIEQGGSKDRSALLALLELEKRATVHGFSTGR